MLSVMQNFLSEVIQSLKWHQTVFGDTLYLDDDIDLDIAQSLPKNTAVPKAEPEPKPQVQASSKKTVNKKDGFSESVIHQNDPEMQQFFHEINHCAKCGLYKSRTNFVFGMGNPHANILFVGEAPGRDEDLQGLPFVGKAGKLLEKMLNALQMKREDIFIANVLKCRPPGNRDPLPEEVSQCEPYLIKQIEMIDPKIIVGLGRISAQVLLKTTDSLTRMRNQVHSYHNIPFLVTYHPAALLRNPRWKRESWQDLLKINTILNTD